MRERSRSQQQSRRFLAASLRDDALDDASIRDNTIRTVGIVGGGLAGLSTAFHLLQKQPSLNVRVIDVAPVGEGGASAVAGGLLHPLSPRGKLVYMGLQALASSNHLLQAAMEHEPKAVLRDEIYRVAVDDKQRQTLQETAKRLPDLTTWMDDETDHSSKVWQQLKRRREAKLLGALHMHNGCKVVHVPTYLQGLWKARQAMGCGQTKWSIVNTNDQETLSDCLQDVDCVVLAAGAGMFQSDLLLRQDDLPSQLVRGQSVEMTIDQNENDNELCDHALLCGKYVSPLADSNRILIGATHEFKATPLDYKQVQDELRERSCDFASSIWEKGTIDRVTSGFRVQSNRGKHGRLPIIGRYSSPFHENTWVFTGLSSRGLLYHGVFGDLLTDIILGRDVEQAKSQVVEDIDWWRQ